MLGVRNLAVGEPIEDKVQQSFKSKRRQESIEEVHKYQVQRTTE